MKAAITIRHLTVGPKARPILHDITTAMPLGLITGLIGPSGAGKTTLMRTIVGLQRTAGGHVSVLEQRPGSRQLRNEIGYMTQAVSIYSDLTVRENLAYFAALIGGRTTVDEAISQVGLADQRQQLVKTLSGGQRSRVSLAVALLGSPRLLVLDEPTVGLDPVLRQQLWEIFRGLANNGTTILISSHAMDEAERCDELILMRDGRILASESPDALKKRLHAPSMEDAFLKLVAGKQA